MIRLLGISITFLVSILQLSSQDTLTWSQLSDVTWTEEIDSSFGLTVMNAAFGKDLQELDGKTVIISGYVIPLDGNGINYALSKYSYAACFFCGQAGPETVLELKVTPRSIPSYLLKEERLTFEGILDLRKRNDTGFNYILNTARRL